MMESKNIFNRIPSGKYHSALITAYSINLYFWELRFMRELSNRGIDYVSAVVDEECLSEQLLHFSCDIDTDKPKRYSLHGFRANGAFHPKIMFFTGRDRVLVFVGSGNLTSCGQGKNLEVWTSVSVESKDDPFYPLILDIWVYLNSIYYSLGPEAQGIITNVETNCSLLSGATRVLSGKEFADNNYYVRFFCNRIDDSASIFSQIKEWTAGDTISKITVLSPFYDKKAELLYALDELFKPSDFRIIVESGGMGILPSRETLPPKCRVYNWKDCKHPNGSPRDQLFHAKCFFLEGEQFHYLLCGSANASVAAMGRDDKSGRNYEACIGFKSNSIDFWGESGLNLPDIAYEYNDEKGESFPTRSKVDVWLREVTLSGKELTVSYSADNIPGRVSLVLANSEHHKEFIVSLDLNQREEVRRVTIENFGFIPIIAYLRDNSGNRISEVQFVIFSQEMNRNSPDSEGEKNRKCCNAIEQGDFINGYFIDFLNKFFGLKGSYQGRVGGKKSETTSEKKSEKQTVEPSRFSSYEEYMEGNDPLVLIKDPHKNSYYEGMNLLDSVLAYARNSAISLESQAIDSEVADEEDEKKNKRGNSKQVKKVIPTSQQQRLPKKLDSFFAVFDKYLSDLEQKTLVVNTKNPSSPASFQELQRFMMVLFLANRLIGYTSCCDDSTVKDSLRKYPIKYSKSNRKTLTEFVFRAIALFGLYVYRHTAIDVDGLHPYYQKKVDEYLSFAFEQSLAIISVCDYLNQTNPDFEALPDYFKMTSLLNIQWACTYLKERDETIYKAMKAIDSDMFNAEIFDYILVQTSMENILDKLDNIGLLPSSTDPSEGHYILDRRIGHVYIDKLMNEKDKRFHPLTAAASYDQVTTSYSLFYFQHGTNKDPVLSFSPCSVYARRENYIKFGKIK